MDGISNVEVRCFLRTDIDHSITLRCEQIHKSTWQQGGTHTETLGKAGRH